jgi:serine/threonine protein kinase
LWNLAVVMPYTPPVQPGDLVADFRITDSLGVGDQGEFFVAEALGPIDAPTTTVVLKIVPAAGNFARLVQEIETFSRVRHPNLMRLYGAGQHQDLFYFSMEWCEQGPVDLLDLDVPARLRAVADAAHGAQALHDAGIVHRNVRPRNIYLRADGSAVLADLSLVLVGGAEMTDLSSPNALGYLDPVLLTADDAGSATDVFSLAATAHHLATGTHLWPGIDPAQVLMAVRRVLREAPEVDRAHCPAGLADLVAAGIDPDPNARPTAAELGTRLRALT